MACVSLHCAMASLSMASSSAVRTQSSSSSSASSGPEFRRASLPLKCNFRGEDLCPSLRAVSGHIHIRELKSNAVSSTTATPVRMAQSAQEVQTATQISKPTKMIVSITGATGFVGSRLVKKLVEDGHTVRVLTRSASKARAIFPERTFKNVEIAEQADWASCIAGSTGVVNLAGTPISVRWTPEVKKDIMDSRVSVTSKVVEAINAAPEDQRPSVFISATAVGFYGTSEVSAFDETSPAGKDYLAEVCQEWEAKAQALTDGVRLVRLRIGIVLDKDGGALAQMVPLFKIFAGGPIGSGKQWFSWVHRDDLVALIVEALNNPEYEGVINGTAPNPVRFTELCDRIGAVLGRPSWLPVPDFALKAVLGEGALVVLEGQRVLPKRAQELGFRFKYQYVTDALRAILT
ncbi:uncharacterized protein MPTK1_2g05740 [Marchantia polymorpha subsp. ruderalis]|uniref:DUF1731 domain-containing protein n=1 Tax=Marchantia polymorpha TaxID=3197 RepID=A0A2R6XDG3_MARPO|nr:hypothetical protein MARPO_0021s0030 [Marchantia polymorpha]BBN01222.1 hypothetical protein Mp_2g05740 [Marchantia polymorpha subsp. ruderalis]|eukprot:PTQ44148.1 hypothetical protein MARPO_0021s0030 [Marchantia polymorpha]